MMIVLGRHALKNDIVEPDGLEKLRELARGRSPSAKNANILLGLLMSKQRTTAPEITNAILSRIEKSKNEEEPLEFSINDPQDVAMISIILNKGEITSVKDLSPFRQFPPFNLLPEQQ